ncbi:MAG: IS21 family transposase [bacterium]|nr:IS21 family transposase [bacterium]
MVNPEGVMNIRSLIKQGYSIRAIARMTGLDRRSVKKYLKDGELPVYHKQMRASILGEYHDLISGWLEQENYQASKIYELVQCQGFKGSYDIVQRHVKKVKEKRDRVAYIRFETMPGQQAQVDFGDFQIIEADGQKKTIYCFLIVLGYSRNMYIEFIDVCTMVNFLACHQHAFGFFGGVPAEILYDNMKNVVIKKLAGITHWNKELEAFAMHYGFKLLSTPVYSPWAKGKVERPIGYLRERFWRGYIFNDISQCNQDVCRWVMNIANDRLHGTTKEKVSIRFEREKPYLGSLPHMPYDISEKVWRKIYKDCQISFGGNKYVLPHEYVGEKVLLKIKDGVMRVFKDDVMIAVYNIPADKGRIISNHIFYQRLRDDRQQMQRKYRKVFWGKAKATRGLIKHGLGYEVMRRSLLAYDQVI